MSYANPNQKRLNQPQALPDKNASDDDMSSLADGGGFDPQLPLLPLEERELLRGCAEACVRVLCAHGFDEVGYKLSGTLKHWYQCASVLGSWMKFMKWKTAAFYAFHVSSNEPQDIEQNVLTEKGLDNPGILLGGRAYKYVRMLKRDKPELFESLLNSILMVKKGCPRPTDAEVDAAKIKTYKSLTTPHDQRPMVSLDTWANIDMYGEHSARGALGLISRRDFTDEMRRTVDELFGDRVFSDSDRIQPFFPSTSANYVRSNDDGGAVGYVLDILRLNKELIFPKSASGQIVNDAKVNVTTGRVSARRTDTAAAPLTVVNTGGLKASFARLYETVVKAAMDEPKYCELVGLKESLKIRVISKGPALTYTALKPLQRFLWRAVSQHPAASLTGQTVDKWYIQSRLGSKLKPGQRYLSVDYSDATNQMHMWVSDTLVDILAEKLHLTNEEKTLFRDGLTGHVLLDPEYGMKKSDKQKGVIPEHCSKQVRGQMMGSVVSFPLLCIVNLTLLRMSKEFDDNRRYTLKDSGVMVNGDDGCVKVTQRGRGYWEKLASWIGLLPSVGKVYFCTEFMNMNSRTFARVADPVEEEFVDKDRGTVMRKCSFRPVPFFNLGLYEGMERSSGSDTNGQSALKPIAARAKELLASVLPEMKERVLKMYITHHKTDLMALKCPWFLPAHLGGVGLPILETDDPLLSPSHRDLCVARLIFEHEDDFALPPALPLNEWKTWTLANKLAKKKGLDLTHRGLAAQALAIHDRGMNLGHSVKLVSSSTLCGWLCVEALMSADKLEDVKEDFSTKASLAGWDKEVKRPRETNQMFGKQLVDYYKAWTKRLLEKRYYEKVSHLVQEVTKNKKYPLAKVLPYDKYHLPLPRPSLAMEPLFPVSYAAQLDTTDVSAPVVVDDSSLQELMQLNRPYTMDELIEALVALDDEFGCL